MKQIRDKCSTYFITSFFALILGSSFLVYNARIHYPGTYLKCPREEFVCNFRYADAQNNLGGIISKLFLTNDGVCM